MKVVFRADASLQMGSGHVMRCLTLADALNTQGAQCHFICREHPGHLLEVIRQRGHEVTGLPAASLQTSTVNQDAGDRPQELAHAAWLGCDWQTDAQQTLATLANLHPDWLVVDHYALDQRWEAVLQPHYQKLMVIDDLAERPHCCDLLLDQNLGRQPQDYASLVPTTCHVLTGPRYALLRPEFAALRDYSLKRRAKPRLSQLLISMGGVDQPNATGQVLLALKNCALPADCRITVVMGLTAPWLQSVRELAAEMPWPTAVVVNVNDMAQRMADSDLAIGAAGSTSWERCCLGLPSLLVVLATNQRDIANGLERAGAAIVFEKHTEDQFASSVRTAIRELLLNEISLINLGYAASKVTNGCGTNIVVDQMLGKHVP